MTTTEKAETGTNPTTTPAKLKQKLRERIDEARQRLDRVKKDIESVAAEDQESLRKKAEEIQSRIDAQKDRAEAVRSQVSSWLTEKTEHGKEAIQTWRQRRESKRLESRADRAEQYAMNALVVAMLDADDAEMAMLEALQARLDADATRVP